MLERELQAKVVKWLKQQPDVWFTKISDRITSGTPDLILCVRGLFVAIELKVKPNKPTALQEHNIDAIIKAFGEAHVCYSIEEVKNVVENALTMSRDIW
jgi:hypothetical protein